MFHLFYLLSITNLCFTYFTYFLSDLSLQSARYAAVGRRWLNSETADRIQCFHHEAITAD